MRQQVGAEAEAAGLNSTSISQGAKAVGAYSVAVGPEANVTEAANYGSAFGANAFVSGASGTALGTRANVTATGAVAIGMLAKTGVEYGVALGAQSEAKENKFDDSAKKATFNGKPVDFAGTTGFSGAVSVGTEQQQRQIQNVGAGRLSRHFYRCC